MLYTIPRMHYTQKDTLHTLVHTHTHIDRFLENLIFLIITLNPLALLCQRLFILDE